jgi:hypothetical protein
MTVSTRLVSQPYISSLRVHPPWQASVTGEVGNRGGRRSDPESIIHHHQDNVERHDHHHNDLDDQGEEEDCPHMGSQSQIVLPPFGRLQSLEKWVTGLGELMDPESTAKRPPESNRLQWFFKVGGG